METKTDKEISDLADAVSDIDTSMAEIEVTVNASALRASRSAGVVGKGRGRRSLFNILTCAQY